VLCVVLCDIYMMGGIYHVVYAMYDMLCCVCVVMRMLYDVMYVM